MSGFFFQSNSPAAAAKFGSRKRYCFVAKDLPKLLSICVQKTEQIMFSVLSKHFQQVSKFQI